VTLIEYIALSFRGLLANRDPFKAALNAFAPQDRALNGPGA
jgi:hypothetical protein